jgi:hypothetical protein
LALVEGAGLQDYSLLSGMVGEPAPTNQNAVGAGSPTIYETQKQSHKPALSTPLFI